MSGPGGVVRSVVGNDDGDKTVTYALICLDGEFLSTCLEHA